MFTRARFLAAAATAYQTVGFVQTARAAQFTFKLGDPDPVDFPVPVRMVEMAHAIKNETNGRMEIQVFPNSTLGGPVAMLGQLRLGSIQLLTMNQSLFSSVVPVSQIGSLGFAFSNSEQAWNAFDGQLGAYIRREFAAKGIYAFERAWETGFKEIISSSHPIRTVEDFVGFKVRALPAPIFVDMFRTLGASAVPLDVNELYTAMQTKVVDGADISLGYIEGARYYEVTKYLSLTHHVWSGYWLAANQDAWNMLPSDIQAIVARNANKYALLERRDMQVLNNSLTDKLQRQGLTANTPSTTVMRAKLGTYYTRWKGELGSTAWGLLEAAVGKLT
jgi:tripartite ATP-independent transporter DctP family solute receptor